MKSVLDQKGILNYDLKGRPIKEKVVEFNYIKYKTSAL